MKIIAHVCVKLNLGDFTTPFRLTRFADSFYQQKPDFPNDAEMVHLSIVDELPLCLLHCLSSLPPPLSPPSPPPSPSSLLPSLCLVKARRDLHRGHREIYIEGNHSLLAVSFLCPLWPEKKRSFQGWRVFILEECSLQLGEASHSEVLEWEAKALVGEVKCSPTEDEVDVCRCWEAVGEA